MFKTSLPKTLQIIYYLLIFSVTATVIGKLGKIIFLLVVISEWSGTNFASSVESVIISSSVIIILKLWRFLPKISQMRKMVQNRQTSNTSVIRRIFRLNRIFLFIYLLFGITDLYNFVSVSETSTLLLVIKWFPICTTFLLLLICGALLIYTYEASRHLGINLGRSRGNF